MPHNTVHTPEATQQPLHSVVEQLGHVVVAESTHADELAPKTPYRIFTNPYERIEYMHLTDNLITTLDGSAEAGQKPYDAVVYLDSSARPISWMVNGMWKFAAHTDEAGQTIGRPHTLFANIDARRTSKQLTPEGATELYDTYPLLARWNEQALGKGNNEPRRVLVVDEIAVSGDTLDVATSHLKEAFPEVTFKGYAWKDERGVPSFRRDNVRWYERKNDRLRAVLDPTELSVRQQAALAERGITSFKKWLSVPNPNQKGSKHLREEVGRMVAEVQAGEMPYWPSMNRPDEEYDALVRMHNDGLTPIQFRQFREWMRRYYAPHPAANLITTDAHGPLTEKEARTYLFMGQEDRTTRTVPVLDTSTALFADKFGYRSPAS